MRNAERIDLLLLMTEMAFLIGVLAVWILFLRTQYRILTAVRPVNRLLTPGLVWLQLIPVLSLIWQLFVVVRLAVSVRKEKTTLLEESLMSNTPPPVSSTSNYPTMAAGLIYCILTIAYCIYDLYILFKPRSTDITVASLYGSPSLKFYLITLVPLALIAGALSSWIAYWVSLARIRRQLMH